MALLFSVLGWCCSLFAIFFALGDPMPGPGYEAARENKAIVLWVAVVLSVIFSAWGLGRGFRRLKEAFAVNLSAIIVGLAWVATAILFVAVGVSR